MKKYEEVKMNLNSAYDAAAIIYTDTDSAYVKKAVSDMMYRKKIKNLKKVLDSGYATSYVGRLSDRELIGKIFYYSGRALQDGNVWQQDDLMTLHFLILEYANRYGEDK